MRKKKTHGYPTEIMGASFRNKEEVLELAGCDLLTISPKLLAELEQGVGQVTRKLSPDKSRCEQPKKVLTESAFRFAFNENPMAVEKLSEGIRKFSADIRTLEAYLKKMGS